MKRALVTGASSDIGQAVCVALAADGYDLVAGYFSDHVGVESTRALVEKEGRACLTVQANLREATGVQATLDAAGEVDVFVHNAAAGVLRYANELKPKHLSWCFEVNAAAFFLIASKLVEGGLKEGGSIVALSSLGATRAIPMYGAVGPSKAALEAMVRQLAVEGGPRQIRANAIAPGMVETRALAHFPNRQELTDEVLRRTPMGRMVSADEVAALVVVLCGSAARMVTGQTIHVDGGYGVVG